LSLRFGGLESGKAVPDSSAEVTGAVSSAELMVEKLAVSVPSDNDENDKSSEDITKTLI